MHSNAATDMRKEFAGWSKDGTLTERAMLYSNQEWINDVARSREGGTLTDRKAWPNGSVHSDLSTLTEDVATSVCCY